ncbi:MAG: DUF6600 domain-containing protein [Candidatus Aminicenantales bacterium]
MIKKTLLAAAVFVLAVGAFGQEAVSPDQTDQERPNEEFSVAHLSFVSGHIFLQRAADLGYEETTLNTPISEGDRLGTDEGRAEIAFGDFKYARLDDRTKIDIQTLSREGSPLISLRHWSGNLYLDLGSLEREKDVEVLTAGATFYFLEEGRYRIDVADDGQTEILVFSGLVEAAAEDGSILVKEGQRLSLANGRFNGRPTSFFVAAEDAFDRWNDERAALVQRIAADSRLPEDIAEYESALEDNGRWMEIDPFGPVWIPAGMASDWRPYSWGRWSWMRAAGWCWVPYEPWGWCTYHYGRWQWHPAYGWYWIPMSGWGPAWVDWWWDDSYFGWAPMSWWGYPGIIYNGNYYGHGWDGDYPRDSRALTVVRKDQLQASDVGRVSLRAGEMGTIGRLNLTRVSPNVRPGRDGALRLEPLGNDNRFMIRKGETALAPAGKNLPASPRVIRSADQPRADEPGKNPAADKPSPERRIRKSEDGRSAGIITFPSRIARENTKSRITNSGSLVDKFYRIFKGTRTTGSSGKTSGARSSSGSRKSGSSSPSRSGTSSGKTTTKSSGGTVRKK